MKLSNLAPVSVRPYVGVRRFAKHLCLYNLKRREAWLSTGTSVPIWERLSNGWPAQRIADLFSAKFGIPAETALNDVMKFVEQLWQRQIIDVPGGEDVSDAARRALVTEEAHNESGSLTREAFKAGVMFNCIFDLLIPCNLRCRHCYLDFSEKDIMPLAEVRDYFGQIAEHGCPSLTLTGGEIFLRHDLMDIISCAEEEGFSTLLLTNGNFIDAKYAAKLGQHHLDGVQISMYGSNAETHEGVTRKPGTFEKSVTAARLLVEQGIRVELAYFIQHDNVEDAYRFPEFARSLKCSCKFDTKLVPNRNGSKELLRYAVTLEQMAGLYESRLVHRSTDFLCTAGASKARITARADVYPCELINTASLGNLRKESLAEIWASPRRAHLRSDILNYKPKRCGGCNHTTECEPCAAMRGYNQPEHMEAPVSEACFLTTASLLARGKSVADSNFLQQAGNECFSSLVHGEGSQPHSPLIQIMAARAARPFESGGRSLSKAL